jgi:hypothetical protein
LLFRPQYDLFQEKNVPLRRAIIHILNIPFPYGKTAQNLEKKIYIPNPEIHDDVLPSLRVIVPG